LTDGMQKAEMHQRVMFHKIGQTVLRL